MHYDYYKCMIRTLVHDNNLEVYVIMKFFIDTANVDYIKEANDMGIICGVTTNPVRLQRKDVFLRK